MHDASSSPPGFFPFQISGSSNAKLPKKTIAFARLQYRAFKEITLKIRVALKIQTVQKVINICMLISLREIMSIL